MKKIIFILFASCIFACKKDFLNEKPIKSLLVPTTLQDYQALLDNYNDVNNIVPALNIISADEYFLSDAILTGLPSYTRNAYLWEKEIFEGTSVLDWNYAYQQIFYSNIVLDGLKKFVPTKAQEVEKDAIMGQALFFRAHALMQLSQLFASPYSKNTAESNLGLPIPLSSDVNIRPGRGNLKQLYVQIETDLLQSVKLLNNSNVCTRPSKAAALGILSRLMLIMGNWQRASEYARACLDLKSELIDYNTLSTTATRPFPIPLPSGNSEIIFYAIMVDNYSFIRSTGSFINPQLIELYNDDDLRKSLFLANRGNNQFTFKGNYTGAATMFGGLATDEVYLILAEAQVRLNEVQLAQQTINKLLVKRYKTGKYIDFSGSAKETLAFILTERRKELLLRGLRWSDLRRLNQEPEWSSTLNRNNFSINYTLTPNDKRYILPIPDAEILNNPIEQNLR